MRTLKFKCKLQSDVIINQKSATEGLQETLDFIPGGNFLGIAARELYEKISSESALKLFHSGAVRFGDAHPLSDNRRSLRVPASMYYPKLGDQKDGCYIHHVIPSLEDQSEEFRCTQLKQCRSEFYVFRDGIGTEIEVEKTFALKSAYDRHTRCSKDKALYSCESINEGSIYCFEVECADDVSTELEVKIRESLVGAKRIGRSKSAQYGSVEIVFMNSDIYTENSSMVANGLVTVYADGRLIFWDEQTGLPTFQPTVEQLGLTGGRILWEKSQIRTFQYAPWNVKRQAYDTDRCGIEKGSVFVVENVVPPLYSQYVGVYNNEGFGKVIYNPEFLEADTKTGKALYSLRKIMGTDEILVKTALDGDAFLRYLGCQKKKKTLQAEIYKTVNRFIDDKYNKLFGGNSSSETFASQWGTIRSIAMQYSEKAELREKIDKYLDHGVAKEKWAERKRKTALDDFIETLTEENVQLAIINLASEMAKKSSKNGER